MFRLVKLAIYGLLGYAIYEFVRGISSEHGGNAEGNTPEWGGSRPLKKALNRDTGRSNITGGGRGERVVTVDGQGESVPHMVGRGVIRR
jgi:hypothetical protein